MSPAGMAELKRHLPDNEGVPERKEIPPVPGDDASDGTSLSKKAKKINKKSRKVEMVMTHNHILFSHTF